MRTFFWAALSSAVMAVLSQVLASSSLPAETASFVFLMALLKMPVTFLFLRVLLLVTRMYFLADFLIGIVRFAQMQNAKIPGQLRIEKVINAE